MTVSVLIPMCNRYHFLSNGLARPVFPKSLDSLRKCANLGFELEIILADQSSTDCPNFREWFDHECGPIPHKFVSLDGDSFNRGRCLNAAAAVASAEILAIVQPDMLIPIEFFRIGLRHALRNRPFFPKYRRQAKYDDNTNTMPGIGTGLCVLTRAQFNQIGGWPEYDFQNAPADLSKLEPDTVYAEHVSDHSTEILGIGTDDFSIMAHRAAAFAYLTSQRLAESLKSKNIKVLSYMELRRACL